MINETKRARNNRRNLQAIIRDRFPESLISEHKQNLCRNCVYLDFTESISCIHDLLPIGIYGQPCIYFINSKSIAGQA